MSKKSKVIIILIAYNAANTLEDFYKKLPKNDIDEVLLFDDASEDHTLAIAKKF